MLEMRCRRPSLALAALLVPLCGCVLPTYDVSGLELSWRFVEVHPVAEEAEAPVRTCIGSGFNRLVFFVADVDDEDRRGSFVFDCELGFQTADEARTTQSEAFVELHGGTYRVVVEGENPVETGVALGTRELTVNSRGATLQEFELAREGVPWRFELAGLETCTDIALSLYYADPVATLTEPAVNDAGMPVPMLYRPMLTSHRGLSLSGAAAPCNAESTAGLHQLETLDPGTYRLEVTRDGQVCSTPVVISSTPMETTIDLANLTC